MSLSDTDRQHIDRARELARMQAEGIRELTGEEDLADAYVIAFGRAQWEIGELLAIIGRLEDGNG